MILKTSAKWDLEEKVVATNIISWGIPMGIKKRLRIIKIKKLFGYGLE